ncbi:MAG: hypothetical protein WD077_04080 [Bacteroidia bacterium]
MKKLRAIRDKINIDIQNMTLKEEKEYLRKMKEVENSGGKNQKDCKK